MFDVTIDEGSYDELTGKVVIITGASSGIGLAATKFFSEHGSQIIAVDVSPPPHNYSNTIFRKVDVTNWTEQYDLFQWTSKSFGRIDIVFLNAGVSEIEDVFIDKFDSEGRLEEPQYKVLSVNLLGPISGTKLAIHFMMKQKSPGSIVITGSGKCFNGIGGTPMYAVSKHGLLGLIRTLKFDTLPESGIRVNMVCPFWTDTGLLSPEQRETMISAEQCMQSADVPAKAVAYLSLHPDAHGQVLYAACGKYTEIEQGFVLSRPIWLGAKNHLDRELFEQEPNIKSFKTKFTTNP